ncbi:hypothetical protein C8Q78DRAFT_613788 [Trametes maxima]|nr:hypothetical protein C8Q78DRAFT_613788 [Trametes maxima]
MAARLRPQFLTTLTSCRTPTRLGRASLSTTARLASPGSSEAYSRGPIGVARAMQDTSPTPSPTLFNSDFSLQDRVALITGGNRGLGLEGALAFIEAGARAVYCLDINDAPGAEWTAVRDYVSRMQGKQGEGRLEYIKADVRDQDGMWKIGEQIGDKEGRLDICFASAGIAGDGSTCLDVRADAVQKVLDVNLSGSLYTAQAAGKQMVRFGKGGSIIFVSSIGGHQAIPNFRAVQYSAAKSGVLQMTRNFACELASEGIRVNCVSPGLIKTAIVSHVLQRDATTGVNWSPMARHGEPHEFRGVVSWLASDASSYCTGTNILVDGGHNAW